MDCHNRPTHMLRSPSWSVDTAFETGRLDRTLPSLKAVALEALTRPYATADEADRGIEASVRGHYERLDPKLGTVRAASINQAVDALRTIYGRSFFPTMKVDWRMYPDNIGHMIFEGCFRCHDGKHRSDQGEVVRRDCTVCHEFQTPGDDPGTLRQGAFEHPVKLEGKHAELGCSRCHTGGHPPARTCAGCHEAQAAFMQGERPLVAGVAKSPWSMAAVECESCHDLSKPLSGLAEGCGSCHDKGYADFVQLWKDDAAAGRAKAAAAIAELRRGGGGTAAKPDGRAVSEADALQAVLDAIDRAGALHNTTQAEALYQAIVKRAAKP
jgi:hypothetical protein